MTNTLQDILARRRVALGFLTGVAALALARPTWTTWSVGCAVAILGEAIRVWAAGHLEKSREVTRSGPYRWMGHPLYVGSAVIALGVVITARSLIVLILVALYMVATLTAAIRTEEHFLRRTFGGTYDRYLQARADPMPRAFSASRALRNREYRAAGGLVIGLGLLALKVLLPL